MQSSLQGNTKNTAPNLQKVILVGGPTASGKTDFAIQLAHEHNGEIISADSRQIYIGMDICTAKAAPRPDLPKNTGVPKTPLVSGNSKSSAAKIDTTNLYKIPFDCEGIPHYLIDILYPDQRYTLFDFQSQAYELIADILSRGKTPIIAGGTGLYFDSLIHNFQLDPNHTAENLELKAQLEAEAASQGSSHMWQQLADRNPTEAQKIHPNNIYQILRSLEFAILNNNHGKTSSAQSSSPLYNYEIYILNPDRQKLYQKIEKRIDQQMELGLLEETQQLISLYGTHLPSITSLGYLHLNSYLTQTSTLDQALTLFKQHTRNYAKRQISWFKRYANATVIRPF